MNKLLYYLIKYPILNTIITSLVLVIYNILLNPKIALDFNWIQYTDSNPYPFDTCNAVYDIDNSFSSNTDLETLNAYDQKLVESDLTLQKQIQENAMT